MLLGWLIGLCSVADSIVQLVCDAYISQDGITLGEAMQATLVELIFLSLLSRTSP